MSARIKTGAEIQNRAIVECFELRFNQSICAWYPRAKTGLNLCSGSLLILIELILISSVKLPDGSKHQHITWSLPLNPEWQLIQRTLRFSSVHELWAYHFNIFEIRLFIRLFTSKEHNKKLFEAKYLIVWCIFCWTDFGIVCCTQALLCTILNWYAYVWLEAKLAFSSWE